MHTCKLDVLGDRLRTNIPVLSHGIHYHFLGMLNELAYYYRMFFRYISRNLEETLQFFLIGTNIHCRSRKYIRRTHQYGETYLLNKGIDVIH